MRNLKYFMMAALGLMAAPGLAQETYQDTKLAENALTGTARYVGMGGAMEALGADISTISSNPAGVGLLRKSQVSLSAGVVAQTDADNQVKFDGTVIKFTANKSRPSFDQVGVVWAAGQNNKNYINLAFNYHKSTNFTQILSAAGMLGGASQSKLTSRKYDYARTLNKDYADMIWTGVDANYEQLMNKSEDGSSMAYYDGRSFLYGQYQKGYIGVYDFNISGSLNNRVWLGLTVGIHDVNYQSTSMYCENLVGDATSNAYEALKIDGTGFDVKAGIIFRPVKDSPFRIGAYVNSPVFYDLTMTGRSELSLKDGDNKGSSRNNGSYDYRLSTPWKAGVSLGHTIGTNLALGATYEYAWYNHMDNRIKDGGYYDGWTGEYYETSSSDEPMNENTRESLKGVSTLKLGLEYKPMSMLSLRLGYNYVSPMFKEDGFRDQSIASPGVAYATSSDFTNWKAINRITCGVGFNYKQFNVDVAYQYSGQKGNFYPFMSYYDPDGKTENDCVSPVAEVKNNRHQVLMTVGYKF